MNTAPNVIGTDFDSLDAFIETANIKWPRMVLCRVSEVNPQSTLGEWRIKLSFYIVEDYFCFMFHHEFSVQGGPSDVAVRDHLRGIEAALECSALIVDWKKGDQ